MGLFDKIFEKKNCGICDKELGLLGKRKLEDGYICKDCASLLSPWFSDRRSSTLADIEAHLADREANKQLVADFNPTLTLGDDTKVIIDEDAGRFIVTDARDWKNSNPDVIDLTQITGCDYRVDESRTEIMREKSDGSRVSYNPKRYDYDYDIYVTIYVQHRWFDEIEFKVNQYRIEDDHSGQYKNAERIAKDIRKHLTEFRREVRKDQAAANAPKMATVCPFCGATTTPTANGCCEFCGGAIG